jgi:archaeosine synthase
LHLPSDIQEFVIDLLKNPIKTCIGKPTSKESLEELSKVLKKKTSPYDVVKSSKRAFENVKGIASYQFGKEIAEKLLMNCKIKGKYPYQKIIDGNKQLGMVTLDRGLISLTLEGAGKLAEFKKYWVEIFDDFELKGSLFAPGIKDSDNSIRIGDEVVVLRNKKVYAVGVAQMNGEEMKESDHGEAIKIRHRI